MTKGSSLWGSAVRQWAEMQDGQSILKTTPSVLSGFRVEVYRAEGTTQWYTAVIVCYNQLTNVIQLFLLYFALTIDNKLGAQILSARYEKFR